MYYKKHKIQWNFKAYNTVPVRLASFTVGKGHFCDMRECLCESEAAGGNTNS